MNKLERIMWRLDGFVKSGEKLSRDLLDKAISRELQVIDPRTWKRYRDALRRQGFIRFERGKTIKIIKEFTWE